MKIGILSDTHDALPATRAALDAFRAEGVTRLLHCGDITGGMVVLLFMGWDVTFVWGNSDKTREDVAAAAQLVGLPVPQQRAILTLDGAAIAVVHGHEGFDSLVASGAYRYVLHGHTHRRSDARVGTTRVINPGALGGRRPEGRSVAVLDTITDTLRFIDIEG